MVDIDILINPLKREALLLLHHHLRRDLLRYCCCCPIQRKCRISGSVSHSHPSESGNDLTELTQPNIEIGRGSDVVIGGHANWDVRGEESDVGRQRACTNHLIYVTAAASAGQKNRCLPITNLTTSHVCIEGGVDGMGDLCAFIDDLRSTRYFLSPPYRVVHLFR